MRRMVDRPATVTRGAVLALSFLVAASGLAQDAGELPSLRAEADSLYGAEKYEDASRLYREVVAAWPDSVAIAYRLAKTLVVTGRPEESLPYLRRTIDAGLSVTSALYYTAIARGDMGDMSAAFATLDTMMSAGFRNKYGLLTDPLLDTLREDERWEAFISGVWGTGGFDGLSQPVLGLEMREGVRIPMRDGVELVANVLIPEEEGPFPTILVRTPYGRVLEWGNRVHWAARGYVLVAQDVRGRGESEGIFDPWMNERTDGYDTVEWIVRQPWSDGKVGMIGASYAAQVQWLAAAERHPALEAIVPLVSGTDPFYDTPYDHGILKQGLLGWVFGVTHPDSTPAGGSWADAALAPLADADRVVTGADLTVWNRWVDRSRPAHWTAASFLEDVARDPDAEDLPAILHVSGWWDVEGVATDRNWTTLQRAGKTDQWLVYGPWEHSNFYEHPPLRRGDLEFGEAARLDYLAEWTRFFDHWLKGKPVGLDAVPRVRAFVIGANRWVEGDRWPLPGSIRRAFHLSNDGPTRDAGALLDFPPETRSVKSFTHDPGRIRVLEDPSFAESTLLPFEAADDRDQLAYVSEPSTSGMTILGPAEVELALETDARDVDLYALLVSIDPGGRARALSHPGKMRASQAVRGEPGRALTPGEPVTLTIPLFPAGYRLPAGHRLGLILRMDWFPRFAPQPRDPADDGPPFSVRTTIPTSPSHVNELRVWILPE